jgi:hypothetical protein
LLVLILADGVKLIVLLLEVRRELEVVDVGAIGNKADLPFFKDLHEFTVDFGEMSFYQCDALFLLF